MRAALSFRGPMKDFWGNESSVQFVQALSEYFTGMSKLDTDVASEKKLSAINEESDGDSDTSTGSEL